MTIKFLTIFDHKFLTINLTLNSQIDPRPNLHFYMTVVESAAWCSNVSVLREFVGNTKASNYWYLVDGMLRNFQTLGLRMSIKLHYRFSHLDDFSENLGDVSEEQGERFHQYVKMMEER